MGKDSNFICVFIPDIFNMIIGYFQLSYLDLRNLYYKMVYIYIFKDKRF